MTQPSESANFREPVDSKVPHERESRRVIITQSSLVPRLPATLGFLIQNRQIQGDQVRMTDIEKIISGGQTGVDRAALDVALELGVPCGGWCPKHRRAEDGRIPAHYPLIESATANYAERTALNARDSDGTLILAPGSLTGGTALTRSVAQRYGRPVYVVDLNQHADLSSVQEWITQHSIRVLNIAGPRESQQPGIHDRAVEFLKALLAPPHPQKQAPKRKRTKRATPRKA